MIKFNEAPGIRSIEELRANPPPLSQVRSALAFIPPDNPEALLLMGKAMKELYGDEGFSIWNEWAQQADKSVRDQLCREVGLE
jgi:hypothetical protein